jgi:hypothetical protein
MAGRRPLRVQIVLPIAVIPGFLFDEDYKGKIRG